MLAALLTQFGKPLALITLVAAALIYRAVLVHQRDTALAQVAAITAQAQQYKAADDECVAAVGRQNDAVAKLQNDEVMAVRAAQMREENVVANAETRGPGQDRGRCARARQAGAGLRRRDQMGEPASAGARQMVKRAGFWIRIFATLAAAVVAQGCAARAPAPPPEVVTANVLVPTPAYCKVPQLAHPQLPIASLTDSSSAADWVRAYAASVALLKAAVIERDSVISGCTAPAASPSPSTASAQSTPESSGN